MDRRRCLEHRSTICQYCAKGKDMRSSLLMNNAEKKRRQLIEDSQMKRIEVQKEVKERLTEAHTGSVFGDESEAEKRKRWKRFGKQEKKGLIVSIIRKRKLR